MRMGKNDVNTAYDDIYAAQLPFVTHQGQQLLRRARVHIAGLGGIGFTLATMLRL
jgi:molybdopterin/thiamine biosynthesis adenylyltransferase